MAAAGKVPFKIKKLKVETDRLEIGTGSECVVRLNDPVAAPRHCAIRVVDPARLAAGGLIVEDLENATGTYVDGKAVTGKGTPLADGSVIVLGMSKIEVKITDGGVTLQPKDRMFGFKKAGEKDGVMVPSDTDRWGLTELRLGRLKSVWTLNRAAVLLLPLILLAVPVYWEWISDPGELTAPHRSMFDVDLASLEEEDCSRKVCRSEGQLASLRIAADQGCESCHDPWGGTPTSKCIQCHDDMMSHQHPFPVDHEKGNVGAQVLASFDDQQCVICHIEHRPSGTFLPELAKAEMRAKTVQLCSECHEGTFDPEKGYEIAKDRPSDPPPFDVQRAYSPVAFPHSVHVDLSVTGMNDCTWCHQPAEHARPPEDTSDEAAMALYRERVSDPANADFAEEVPYERCEICHSAGFAAAPEGWAVPEDLSLFAADLRQKRVHREDVVVWDVDWHGSDDARGGMANCQQCHLADSSGDSILYPDPLRPAQHRPPANPDLLYARVESTTGDAPEDGRAFDPQSLAERAGLLRHATVSRVQAADASSERALYAFEEGSRRTHQHLFQDAVVGKECSECHRDRKVLEANAPEQVSFWHALHLKGDPGQLASLTDGAALAQLDAQCQSCHTDMAGSEGLTDHAGANPAFYHLADADRCARCHTQGTADDGGPWMAMRPTTPPPAVADAMLLADFPHDAHVFAEGEWPARLVDGCLSCHEFEAPEGESIHTLVRTKVEVQDCASCHARHRHVAGNSCDKCHPQPAAEGTPSADNPPPFNHFWSKAPAKTLAAFGPLGSSEAGLALPTRSWPMLNSFQHFSPGHAAPAEPGAQRCEECHVQGSWTDGPALAIGGFAAAEAAADAVGRTDYLAFVPVPTEGVDLAKVGTQDTCRECHLDLNTHRFHWR